MKQRANSLSAKPVAEPALIEPGDTVMSDPAVASACASVHSIDHFALNVPSLAEAERFFSSFGLDVAATDKELELRAADGHRWARVFPASRKSLAYLSFNCFEEDFAAICEQVKAAGADLVVSPNQGFWFHDPDGNLIQVKVGPKTTPFDKEPCVVASSNADERGAHMRSEAKTVRPRRLSHVLLFSPDVLGALDFYGKALGLRLSDKSLDIIAFT
jgi:catechol 2,3-dioxygenase